MKYNLYFHCSENTAFYIFTGVKYSFFNYEICIIFNQYFSVFHYFVYNKIYLFSLFIFQIKIRAQPIGITTTLCMKIIVDEIHCHTVRFRLQINSYDLWILYLL